MSGLMWAGVAGWLVAAFWCGWAVRGWHFRRGTRAQTVYLAPGQSVSITNNDSGGGAS